LVFAAGQGERDPKAGGAELEQVRELAGARVDRGVELQEPCDLCREGTELVTLDVDPPAGALQSEQRLDRAPWLARVAEGPLDLAQAGGLEQGAVAAEPDPSALLVSRGRGGVHQRSR